ncbi:MAG: DHH family phosphoesterase [Candidatus Bilamarchaeaceae archaeon]
MRKNLNEIIAYLRDKKILLTSHRKPDIDSVVSLFVLKELLPNAVIALTSEKDESAKNLIDYLGLEFEDLNKINLSDFDGLVVADTSSTTLVPIAKEAKIFLLIDHHQAEGRDIKADFEIIDSQATATSEIIAILLEDAGMLDKISKKAIFALCCGIVFDSARFKSARAQTFKILSKLMELAEESYEKIREYAEPPRKRDEQLAILRGFQRLEIYEIDGYVIATSNVGSNASDTASFLAEVAHVSFVAEFKEKENETRLSARAAHTFPVPLNEIAARAADKIGGKGGGHKKAAGLSVKNKKPSEVLKACLDVLKEVFSN